ncbi:cation-transporting P-type ATPase [Geobacter sulfurreducens subsp. ethanolicus]|uniref:cation-transporting P-type ATPase n=1 Tax=Geobacter sulfurreducens TaxID=35554 RepID=UPI002573DA23|nr:cation-transporting P-type ATPase [Geobacter sulfurreducens]BEH09701.1 cation-transporting P-type ATPase [Geobacter sulfurreducens subsp. ethanolicus]
MQLHTRLNDTSSTTGTEPGGLPWHASPEQEVLARLETGPDGLTAAEAAERLRRLGPNTLLRKGGDGPLLLFWRQINNPIGWLLVAAGALALALRKPTDAAVVFGAVFINAIIGFIQEYRAGKAIEALSAMIPEATTSLREGRAVAVPADLLVPGDLVTLQSGDKVPADLRLIRVKNLLVEEAALTGESLPVAKQTDPVAPDAPLGDRVCMAYSGTLVVQGTATGVVVATGNSTELGRINALLNQTSRLETPLTRQLATVSSGITIAVVVVVAVLIAFGIWIKDAPVGEALMVAVSLAVAAIPEGLPAVITICMAIGVRRMADRHAVVRHLPAVETLGSTSVICSDKTGTLTRNEMTVQVAWLDDHEYRFAGIGYEPAGEIEHDGIRLAALPPTLEELLAIALLCNDAALRPDGDGWAITGDPTEAALVVAGRKGGLDDHELRGRHGRLDVIPFESDTKFMATLNRMEGGHRILLKGAPEIVLDRCVLSEPERRRIHEAMETYARQGMRVIACASKEADRAEDISPEDVAGGLTFAGLLCMIDPPRTEAMDAIRECHGAGITVKMITGDHPVTAEAIGRQLGLLQPDQTAMEGRRLDGLSGAELQEVALATNVFARVAPEHKIRLVEALQARGYVVAMTGDGVNDAPALKRADIGVAMGITGTAVSKEAAKVVLMDDNFASIAAAVEEGRRVYDNLVRSLAFVLPTNLGLACTLSVAMFFFPTVRVEGVNELLMAMSPSQTLWINLVASVTLSIPLAFEVLEPNAMHRPPRSPGEPVFSGFIVARLIVVAILMAAGGCGLFLWEYFRIVGPEPVTAARHARALAEAQTMCVTSITFTQVFYLLNCRSLRDSLLSQGVFSNPAIFIGIGILLLLQACFIYLPPLQAVFGTAPLDGRAWLYAMLAGAVVLPVISLDKWVRRHSHE